MIFPVSLFLCLYYRAAVKVADPSPGRYMHRNPVKRGLVEKAEDWPWSSYRHYLTGQEGSVEIESGWTCDRRERQTPLMTMEPS
jgi:hypothetical protein